MQQATIKNHLAIVQLLLDANANTTATNTWGHTPLESAVQHNRWDAVALIGGDSALHHISPAAAVEHEQWGALVALLDAGKVKLEDLTSDPSKLLLQCAGGGATEHSVGSRLNRLIQKLLDAGADLRYRGDGMMTPLYRCLSSALLTEQMMLHSWNFAYTSGFFFQLSIQLPRQPFFLSSFLADVHVHEMTSTFRHVAVWSGNVEVVSSLLAAAADPTAKNDKGMTALHIATEQQSVALVTQLLDAGASARVSDENWTTPLHIACRNSDHGSVKELLEGGANPNASTAQRRTPLHFTRDVGVFKQLIDAGASANCVDETGKMPVEIALDIGNTMLVAQYLRPCTLALFAPHQAGCATPLNAVEKKCGHAFVSIVDTVVIGIAKNTALQIPTIAEHVRAQLLRQQQLWTASHASRVGVMGGGHSLSTKGWPDQLRLRMAHLESYLKGYVEALIMNCSLPVPAESIANMDAMLVNPTVGHIRSILLRLLAELDTAASYRAITILHKKAVRAHEVAFESTKKAEDDQDDFNNMIAAFDDCVEAAAASAASYFSRDHTTSRSAPQKSKLVLAKKKRLRQPLEGILQLALKAREMMPIFEAFVRKACNGIAGLTLVHVFSSKPIIQIILKGLLIAEPASTQTVVGAAAHVWRLKTAQFTGREAFQLLSLTDYSGQLDIVSATVKCSTYTAMAKAIASFFKLSSQKESHFKIVSAINTMKKEALHMGECREVILNAAAATNIGAGVSPGGFIMEIRLTIAEIEEKDGTLAPPIRPMQELLELFAYMEKWGSPSSVASAASAASARDDSAAASHIAMASAKQAQLEEDHLVLREENELLRSKLQEFEIHTKALEAQLDDHVERNKRRHTST